MNEETPTLQTLHPSSVRTLTASMTVAQNSRSSPGTLS